MAVRLEIGRFDWKLRNKTHIPFLKRTSEHTKFSLDLLDLSRASSSSVDDLRIHTGAASSDRRTRPRSDKSHKQTHPLVSPPPPGHFSVSFLLILFFSAKLDPPKTAKHFVHVHGSCHGGWSWYKLMPLLKSTGHAVTALDLAASGVDLRQPKDLRSISDYFGPLTELMEALPANERVVLVGHSLGGLAISQSMERFPAKISVAVFLTAQMPGPSLNISTLNREPYQSALMSSGRSKGVLLNNRRKLQIRYHFHRYYGSKFICRLHRREDRRLLRNRKKPSSAFGVLHPPSFISSSDLNSVTWPYEAAAIAFEAIPRTVA